MTAAALIRGQALDGNATLVIAMLDDVPRTRTVPADSLNLRTRPMSARLSNLVQWGPVSDDAMALFKTFAEYRGIW